MKKYDYIVIGSGAAGIHIARTLGREKTVAVIEKEKLGGTAMRTGAVPIKKLLDSFKTGRENLKVRMELVEDWEDELEILDEIIREKLEAKNIDIYMGEGEFVSSNVLRVNGEEIWADKVIIATGTSPKSLANIKLDGNYILSHKDLMNISSEKKTIVVYGGNVEGVEVANYLQLFSNNVIIIEKEKTILHDKDEDLVQPIKEQFIFEGGRIITGLEVKTTEIKNQRLYTELSNGEVLISDLGVLTFSRTANLPKGLENTGIELEGGYIKVDGNFKTNDDNIYAIGDINGIHGMAHVAVDQARKLGEYFLRGKKIVYDYKLVPGAYFTSPEYVGVGYCEKDLSQPYKLGLVEIPKIFRGWTKGYLTGTIKAILDEDNKVLGIHLVGDGVSEYLGFLSHFIGRPGVEILDTLAVYPSFADGIKEAVERAIYGSGY